MDTATRRNALERSLINLAITCKRLSNEYLADAKDVNKWLPHHIDRYKSEAVRLNKSAYWNYQRARAGFVPLSEIVQQ